jgi:hypothetical protein
MNGFYSEDKAWGRVILESYICKKCSDGKDDASVQAVQFDLKPICSRCGSGEHMVPRIVNGEHDIIIFTGQFSYGENAIAKYETRAQAEKAYINHLSRMFGDLVGVAEAAEILGWDKRKIATYISRGVFPDPVQRLASGPIWTRKQIEDYKNR